jgi:hypothetical protein
VKTAADRAWYERRRAELFESLGRDRDAIDSWKRCVPEFAGMPASKPEEA